MLAAAAETKPHPARTIRRTRAAQPSGHASVVRLLPPRQTPLRAVIASGVAFAPLETTDGSW